MDAIETTQTQAEAVIEYYQERFKSDLEKAKAAFMEAAAIDPANAFVWRGQALLETQALYDVAKAEGFYDEDFGVEQASNVFTDFTGRFMNLYPYQLRSSSDLTNAADAARARATAEFIKTCYQISHA